MYPTPSTPPSCPDWTRSEDSLISSPPGNHPQCSAGLGKVVKNEALEALMLTVKLPVTTGNTGPKQKEGWLVAEPQ